MKYLILLKSNPEWAAAFASFTPEQQAEGMALYETVFRELGESGELVDAEQLAGPETVKTVRATASGPVASDGPYTELKEFLGGYYLVDVESLDRAVEIAGRFPEAGEGLVEVLPILQNMTMASGEY